MPHRQFNMLSNQCEKDRISPNYKALAKGGGTNLYLWRHLTVSAKVFKGENFKRS